MGVSKFSNYEFCHFEFYNFLNEKKQNLIVITFEIKELSNDISSYSIKIDLTPL